MSLDQLRLSLPEGCSLWQIDTSFLDTQWLLVTPSNRKFHVSAKASDVIEELLDEAKSLSEIASALSKKWNTVLSPEDVLAIIESSQWPNDLIKKTTPWDCQQALDESIEERGQKPLFGDFFIKFTLVPDRIVRWITSRMVGIYNRSSVFAWLLAIAYVHYGAYSHIATLPSLVEYFTLSPAQYVAAFCLMTLTVIFHEIGHATASARFGVKPGGIGFGIYFIYPALYTELGFAWLLPRMKRAAVDVGGFYFQLIATVPIYIAFLIMGDSVYLLTILSADFLIIFSLIPFFKFDGYWLLSDLLGVPNLQKRAVELIRSPIAAVKSRVFETRNGMVLPRRVTIILLVYGILFIAFQTMIAGLVLRNGPGVLLKAPATLFNMTRAVISDFAAGRFIVAANQSIKIFMLLVMTFALVMILRTYAKLFWRFGRWVAQKVWQSSGATHISTEGRYGK